MTTQQPGTGPVPDGTEGPEGTSGDDTQRLDAVSDGGAPTERLDLARDDAHDGGTRILPAAEEPSGVDALWGLGRPDDAAASSSVGSGEAWSSAAAGPTTAAASSPSAAPSAPMASDEPSAPTQPRERTGRRGVRVGAVVWGLVVAVCGVLALAAAGGASIDGGTVAIAILGGAGVALVLGSIVTGLRRRDPR
ncbi:hypothetical protein [Luteimicrobium sp. DT211]|uniref:hypothetical protein n=1 Tax=Luteimicrobium sp. DT211 TaxID=3393412 RepID=UPI003CF0FBBE